MSALGSGPFTLGINVPWITCGHDFGPRPPAWSGAPATDWAAVEVLLRALSEDGLTLMRWWVLGGGVNLPAGAEPGSVAWRVPFDDPWPWWQRPFVRRRRDRPERWAPRGPLPALPDGFLQDFERLLAACEAAGVRLVPSLMSFELFLPIEDHGGPTSGGRGAFVLGERQGAFFDATLEPLLEVAERRRGAVAAWEVANEPGWATLSDWRHGVYGKHPPWVSGRALSDLVAEGARRIARRGFVATVGFVDARPRWLEPRALETLRRLAGEGAYVHQRHHYPGVTGVTTLPSVDESPIRPCWVGELATGRSDRWGDPGLAEDDDDAYLERRIARVRDLGYDAALLWAARSDDPHARWDEGTIAQVRRAAGLASGSGVR